MKSILATLLALILFLSASAQDCNLQFVSHQNGSIITTRPFVLEGIAKIPVSGHVWVLAHLKGFDAWWPQGNGQRQITNGKWSCAVYLGEPGETGNYEIAVVVVNDQVNQSLKNWVDTAPAKGYPPIPFPDKIEECPIALITVEKRQQ